VAASPQAPQAGRSASRLAAARGDIVAILALIALSLAPLGPHLLGWSTFIGDSDRLHVLLNMRELAVDGWQTLGRVPAWSDAMHLGLPVYGLHWLVLAVDPVSAIMALFPAREAFRVAGYLTAFHIAAGALAAYWLFRDVVQARFPAAVGAAIYACGALGYWIGQFDTVYDLLILQAIGLLVLRRVRSGRLAVSFLALTAIVTILLSLTFLQSVTYVLFFLGAYACYRLLALRDWRPLVALGGAGVVGILLSVPRLGTVAEDFRELYRSSSIQSTCACELLRWFDDGIFGRYPQEIAEIGNTINFSEGFQLYLSTFAAAGVIALLLRPRGGPARLAGLSFLLVLALLFLPVLGGGPEAALLVTTCAVLALWSLARPALGRRFGMPQTEPYQDVDLRFFLLFTLLAFVVILSDPVRYLLYLAFFRVDFTHARISMATLLPLSALAAIFLRELFGGADGEARGDARHLTALSGGAVLAVIGVLVIEPLAPLVATVLFGPTDRLDIGSSYLVSARELGRVIVSGSFFLIVLWWSWLARHVSLTRVDGHVRPGWRDSAKIAQSSALRLMPAYTLGCLMVVQVVWHTSFVLNGEHTQTYPVPFVANNNFTAPIDVLRPPSPAARQALRDRLETPAYRSITISAPDGYPAYDWPSERGYVAYVAMAWQFRLANGYQELSRRIVELPWPEASRTLRTVTFKDQRTVPWPLLSVLNVKYAIIASPSLIFNVPSDPARRGAEAGPEDLTILENPLPAVPRAFFTAAVTPRVAPPQAPPTALPAPPNSIRAVVISERGVVVAWAGEVPDASYLGV
jgi:hypothetical protein